jgi:hypothetical protein
MARFEQAAAQEVTQGFIRLLGKRICAIVPALKFILKPFDDVTSTASII